MNITSPLSFLNEFDRRKLCATFIYEIYEKKNVSLTLELGYYQISLLLYLVHCVECKINKKEKLYILQLPHTVNQVVIQKVSEISFTVYEIHNLFPGYAGSSSSG